MISVFKELQPAYFFYVLSLKGNIYDVLFTFKELDGVRSRQYQFDQFFNLCLD